MTLPRARRPLLIEMPSLIRSPAAAVRFSCKDASLESTTASVSSTHPFRTGQIYEVELRSHRYPLSTTIVTRILPSSIPIHVRRQETQRAGRAGATSDGRLEAGGRRATECWGGDSTATGRANDGPRSRNARRRTTVWRQRRRRARRQSTSRVLLLCQRQGEDGMRTRGLRVHVGLIRTPDRGTLTDQAVQEEQM